MSTPNASSFHLHAGGILQTGRFVSTRKFVSLKQVPVVLREETKETKAALLLTPIVSVTCTPELQASLLPFGALGHCEHAMLPAACHHANRGGSGLQNAERLRLC
eukprot:1368839-Pleurochrysis_carterae.AAC.13